MKTNFELLNYNQFVEALEVIDDEDMRFEYIIDIGKRTRNDAFPEGWKIEANLMHGCMSKVWIVDQREGERHFFKGYSDAVIVKGLVSMMTESFSGLTADELNTLTEEDVRKLNLGALTTQRQIGMMAMLEHMKTLSLTNSNLPFDNV